MKARVYIVPALLAALFSFTALSSYAFNNSDPFDSGSVKVETKSNKKVEDKNVKVSKSKDAPAKLVGKKGRVRASALNVRTGPWQDVLGLLYEGDTVEITGTLGDWYKIKYKGREAYVHSKWVEVDGVKQSYPDYGTVTNCCWLNVRRAPWGDILTSVPAGTKFSILGESGDWYKVNYNGNEAFVSKKYIDTNGGGGSSRSGSGDSFTGYVDVGGSSLNVRDGVWGNIVGSLYTGDKVEVIGKSGDWYMIKQGGATRYVHSDYVSKSKPNGGSAGNTGAVSAQGGSLQEKIANSARALIGSTNFRGPEVDGGNLACAQVVTTALRNAGALDRVYLNCRDTVRELRNRGWSEVTVPPFQEGDVITWKTYDYTGDGVKDPDTHIGIMIKEGNTYKAMNNSSSMRMPRVCDPFCMSVTRVLRKK